MLPFAHPVAGRCALWLTMALSVGACTGLVTEGERPLVGQSDAQPGGRPDARSIEPGQPDARPAQPGDPDARPAQPGSADAGAETGLAPEVQRLFEVINAERAARGLRAVTLRDDLVCAAARHSADIGESRQCTHTGADGSDPGVRVAECGGGGWSGEIVACGQASPEEAVQAWINSPGHNAIMLAGEQRYIGVGMHRNFWTAIFDR